MDAQLGTAVVPIRAPLDQLEKDLQKAKEKIDKGLSGALEKLGSRFDKVGKGLSLTVSAPIAGLGGVALKTAVDFESAFAGVRKTVDATEAQFGELRQGIRDMANEMPVTREEIAGVAEAAGQLGIARENILSFSETMLQLGVATNLSSDEAATALARLANITQMPQTEFDRLGATIVALGNNLATTEAEIVEMGLRIAGAGSQIGLTEPQILSIAGALSSVGIEAEAGGTAISRVMIELANVVMTGGEGLDAFAAVAGMTGEQFAAAFRDDAAGAVISFVEGLGRMSAEGENVFAVLDELELGEIRVRDALLRASGAGDLLRRSIELGSQAWEDNTALTKEAEQRFGTTESQLTIFWNRLTDVAVTLGDSLVPMLNALLDRAQPLIDFLGQAAQWFANLDPTIQTIIIAIAGLLAVVGPLLIALGLVLTAIAPLIPIITAVGAALAGIALGPILLVIAAVAGLAIAWSTNLFGVRDVADQVIGALPGIFEAAFGFIQGIVESVLGEITPFIQEMLGIIAEFWAENGAQITEIVDGIWSFISTMIGNALEVIRFIVEMQLTAISTVVQTVWGALAPFIGAVLNSILTIIETAWGIAKIIIRTSLENILDVIGIVLAVLRGDWQGAWDGLVRILERTWQAIGDVVMTGVRGLIEIINHFVRAWNDLEFSIPGFSVQLPSVEIPGVGTVGGGNLGWEGLIIRTPNVFPIPALAEGALVMPQPGGVLARLAEAGRPEVVAPLDRLAQLVGGGDQMVINVNVMPGAVQVEGADDGFARRLGSGLARAATAIAEAERRTGSLARRTVPGAI